jgi:hypothetical protein
VIWSAILVLAGIIPGVPHAVAPTDASARKVDASEGKEVLAVIKAIEPKSYTDDLPDGNVLVSDVLRFEVIQPTELAGLRVMTYYQGIPQVEGRRLALGDRLYFKLPSAPSRDGIFFGDLKGLRFGK